MKLKFFVVLLTTLFMSTSSSAKPPGEVQARVEAWLQGRPGGVAVAWVDAEGVTFFQAGKFSANDVRPVTADTQFEIGSITKVFTALLLTEGERLNKLGLDDPVGTYLLPTDDEDRDTLAKITLRSLATHTSGLARLASNFPTAQSPNPYVGITRVNLVEELKLDGPKARPGRSVEYSNFGFALLGSALGEAFHLGYDDALQAQVLAPLNLRETVLAMSGLPPAKSLAPGHSETGAPVASWEFDAYAPCGALRSTARDLATFLQAALGEEKAPLHAAFIATTTAQPGVKSAGSGGVGLGWMITADEKRPVFWHNGGTGGYRSFIGFTRADGGAGVVILTNHAVSVDEMGFALLGVKSTAPVQPVVENAGGYVGRYVFTPAFAIGITTERGLLFAQATNQGRNELMAVGPDLFSIKGVAAKISFTRSSAGKISGLVLHQNGLNQPAKRAE